MYTYRLHLADGTDAGTATYAVLVPPRRGDPRRQRPAVPRARCCAVRGGGRVAVRRAAAGRGCVVAENDRGSSEQEPKAHRDEGYPALGRYLVALSGMVSLTREQMDFFAQATGSHPALKGSKGAPSALQRIQSARPISRSQLSSGGPPCSGIIPEHSPSPAV